MSRATDVIDKALATVNSRMDKALHLWARKTQDDIRDRFAPYSKGGVGGDKIQTRSGGLRDSIRRGVFGSEARVWSDHKSVLTHEEERTINAKSAYSGLPGGPYLSFPTFDNTNDSGSVIFPLSRLMQSKSRVYLKTSGGYVLGQRGDGGFKGLFHLRKSVHIKARLHAKEIATRNAKELVV